MSRLILLPRPSFDLEHLKSRLRAGDVLLPLTVEGQARVAANSAPWTPLEELVPYSKLCELARQAHRLLAAFAESSGAPLVIDGIDWHRLLLSDSQLLYFRALLLGQELARALDARGYDRFVWAGEESYPPHLPFHALVQTLRFHLTTPLETWKDPRGGSGGWLTRLRNGIARKARRLRTRLLPARRAPGGCQIVAIFATSEWRRFTEPLAAVHALYGKRFQLWYLGHIPQDLRAWASSLDLSVSSVPYPQTVASEIQLHLEQRFIDWARQEGEDLANRFDCPALASGEQQPHFKRLFTYTLAHFAQWARTLRGKLEEATPEILLGSAAFNLSTAFPYYVADTVNLPSVALPHTYVPGDHTPVASTYLICRNRFDREGFARAFPDDARVLYSHEAANSLSYEADASSATTGEKRIVAVLTASPTTDGLLLPIVEIGEFLDSMAAIARPPSELESLRFIYKSHPRYDVSSLLREQPDTSEPEIFPSSAPVTDLLRRAWTVVICNHYGSVVVEAAATGRPIIFMNSARFCYPGVDKLAFAAGEVVSTVPELWRELRELAVSRKRYQALAARCRSFGDRHLQPAEASLCEVLQNIGQESRAIA